MKTSELNGVALDWAVAKSELLSGADYTLAIDKDMGVYRVNFGGMYPEWVKDWKEGGELIESKGISIWMFDDVTWKAQLDANSEAFEGATPLIAAMRCYVASKLGGDVEVPADLFQ